MPISIPELVSIVGAFNILTTVVQLYISGSQRKKLIAETNKLQAETFAILLGEQRKELELTLGERDTLADRIHIIEDSEKKCQTELFEIKIRLMKLELTTSKVIMDKN